MMLTTQYQFRQYNVFKTVVSARIEGIALTKQLEENLADYVADKKTVTQLIEETKQRFEINCPK